MLADLRMEKIISGLRIWALESGSGRPKARILEVSQKKTDVIL